MRPAETLGSSDALDPETLRVVHEIIDRVLDGLKMANLIQDDRDAKSKHVEWYRGGAQVLIGLKGELASEVLKREEKARPSPEAAVERALRTLQDNEVTPKDLEGSKAQIQRLAAAGVFSPTFVSSDPDEL